MTQGATPLTDETGSSRHFVFLSHQEPAEAGALAPIGPRCDVLEKLANYNTGPEVCGDNDVLYGPGIQIELTPGQDPLTQMLVTITEEEIGWLVLRRLINVFQWRLLDARTGAPADLAP